MRDAQVEQRVGGLLHLGVQLGIRDVPGVTGRLAHEVEGDLVAAAGLDVPVDAVVRRVELAVDEPRGERRVAPVQDLGERLAPGEVAAGLVGPEALVVGLGGGVQVRGSVGLRGELRVGGEAAVLGEQVLQGFVRHGSSNVQARGSGPTQPGMPVCGKGRHPPRGRRLLHAASGAPRPLPPAVAGRAHRDAGAKPGQAVRGWASQVAIVTVPAWTRTGMQSPCGRTCRVYQPGVTSG